VSIQRVSRHNLPAEPQVKLRVVDGLPPNFETIKAVLPEAAADGVMFAYDGAVYGRGLKKLSPELEAHETVHLVRQIAHPGGVDGWWKDYLANPRFRFVEELWAHRAEHQRYKQRNANQIKRALHLNKLARRLVGPLYAVDGLTLMAATHWIDTPDLTDADLPA
jgi:hypothetical protein